jgi:HEAT repeat protein
VTRSNRPVRSSMSNKPKTTPKSGRRAWHVATLLRHALNTRDEKAAWECVVVLHARGTREVFFAAEQLCRSSDSRKRRLGADILGQLGTPARPFRRESLKILHNLLCTESAPKVLNSMLTAIGHCQEKNNQQGLGRIAKLRAHRSENVRFGVVMALLGRTNRISLNTLISLTTDTSDDVRDWATFGLGTMVEVDTPKLRNALARRLNDSDGDTRCEAIAGLAKRKDPRARDALLQELKRDNTTSLVFEAAAEFGDITLLPYIQQHSLIANRTKNPNSDWLRVAQESEKVLTNLSNIDSSKRRQNSAS